VPELPSRVATGVVTVKMPVEQAVSQLLRVYSAEEIREAMVALTEIPRKPEEDVTPQEGTST
jgi:hypothetical protein